MTATPGDGRRFFFAHVQKAAGTSLYVQLQRQFAGDEIYPDPSDKVPGPASILFVSHLRERYRARHDRIRVVTGHFPLRTTELLGDDFVTLSVVRDPVERTLSFLRHHRLKTPADAGRPLEEIYEDPIRFHGLIHNNMVKMFSLSPEELTAGDGLMTHVQDFTPARLAEAKRRLQDIDVLGLDVHYAEFVAELNARFAWQLGPPTHANRTELSDVAESFRRRIAADNADDAELFAFAEELHRQRRADAGRTVLA
jgi:hypothetical protein